MGPITTVFSVNEEKELVAYLKLMEGRLFGLSSEDFRKLAYQLAIKNNINHNFNNDKKEAGYDWLKGFERGIQTYHFEYQKKHQQPELWVSTNQWSQHFVVFWVKCLINTNFNQIEFLIVMKRELVMCQNQNPKS